MATLEKIRSKSVFLIIVIGVALLAFIIGDALTNSRNLFGDQSTVAKIGSEKIDYTDYQRKREELNRQLEEARKQNPAQYANFDTQLLPQMAIDQLINEQLMDEAVGKLGIRTSGELLRYYMIDNPANEKIGMLISQLNAANISVQTPQQAYEVIFNPKRSGLTEAQVAPFQRMWLAIEEETKQLVARQTYSRLLYGTVKANELDKKALYDDYVSTSQVELAFKPYGRLDEKKYPVSDAEINKAYEAEKNRFRVNEPTKEVSFIAVNIAPSQADRAAAAKLAQTTLTELRSDSAAQLSKFTKKEGVSVTRRELRAADLPAGAVKDFVLAAANGAVELVSDNARGFTVVKMGSRRSAVDSIQLNLVQVLGQALPAKVAGRLNAGLSLDSISTAFSADSVMAQPAQWIPLFTAQGRTGALEQSQLDSLLAAGGKYITLMQTQQGALLAQVKERRNPVEIYEFDEYHYTLKPSTATVSAERTKLEKFLAQNNTAKKFADNAAKAGYTVQNFDMTQSTPAVPRMAGMNMYYPDSRQVVRWVMIDGEPGEVSHIYESKDALNPVLYAVAVDTEYDDYVPAANEDVRKYLTDKVRRSKAGEAMVKEYKPATGSVANAAAKMGVQATTLDVVRLGRISGINDAKVAARIAGSKADRKVNIIKGDDGVYVYRIDSKRTENFPYNGQQYEQQYYQFVNPDLGAMLRGSKKFTNNAYKFEAGE